MDDSGLEDVGTGDPGLSSGGLLRRAELIGRVALLIGRTATVLAVVALVVGLVVWGLAAGLDVASGLALWVVLALCLVPAGGFVVLSWSTRRVARDARHYPADLQALYGELRSLPANVEAALRALHEAAGLRARVRALRQLEAVVEGSEATSASRERFQTLHLTATAWVPTTTAIGLVGLFVLAVAVPVVLAAAVVS